MAKTFRRIVAPIALVLALAVVLLLLFIPRSTKLIFWLFYAPQRDDIVFQSLPTNALTAAIEGITHSPYSHCGMVDLEGGQWVVIESIGDVHVTPLSEWAARGNGGRFDAYRLPAGTVDQDKVIAAANKRLGLPYDLKYEMDEAKIYCSELVYKAYKEGGGIELGTMQRLGDLDWQPYAPTIMAFEQGPVPLDRLMISPVSLARDPRLVKAFGSLQ